MKKLVDNRWFLLSVPFLIWFLVLLLPFLLGVDSNNSFPGEVPRRFIFYTSTSIFLLGCVFYLHTYAVYPLLNKKVIWYIFGLISLLGLYWLCLWLLKAIPPHGPGIGHQIKGAVGSLKGQTTQDQFDKWRKSHGFNGPPKFAPIIPPVLAVICSVFYRLILDNRSKQQLLKERETAQLKSELIFLRSQVSPHFMFNTLNNLAALARKKSDDLEPAILNLSYLLRYALYESDGNQVSIGMEIGYIKSYVNLQMLRFGKKVTVNIDVEGDTQQFTIEPMLLIPFIENAFKHGTGMVNQPVIDISIAVDAASQQLHFKVINKVSPKESSKDEVSGIGIVNIKRRLEILHPGKHELNVSDKDGKFTVDLKVYLTTNA